MSNLRQFIERVLAKRDAHRPKLEEVKKNLQTLDEQLSRLRQLATEAPKTVGMPLDLERHAATLVTTLDDLTKRVKNVMDRTANLLSRFAKRTINIGVAGKARQGKSTILQAISGLDNRVIPTSNGLPCTGAKSRIVHQADDPHALIEYYKTDEFLREIVLAYYEELKLSQPPATLDEFERNLPPERKFEKPGENAVYEKLRELHAGLGAYRPYLSRPEQRASLDEVRDYVSQEDGRKRYLAVRCANIYVPFPNSDVSGLALVDLPGLGEIAKGHSEKLVTSLQSEIDAIVLVKLPADTGDAWFEPDIKVFNEIKKAVPELDLADWLFVVLNVKQDGSNAQQVEMLKNRPPQVGSSPRLLAVNCLQPEMVRQGVFLEVLRHLEQNLERIDQRQIGTLTAQLAELAKDVSSAIGPIKGYLQKDSSEMEQYQKFGELFRSFCEGIRIHLDELVEECRRMVDEKKVNEWTTAVEEACDAAKAGVPIPSAEELKRRFHNLGGWKGVVQEQLHHLRSYLTQTLAEKLDKRLGEMVKEAQRKFMARMMAEPLGRVLPEAVRKNSEPLQQLEAFRQLLDVDSQPTLVAGVDYLRSFSFSYHSHFHHRVRGAMDPLDPMAIRDAGDDDPVDAIVPRGNDVQHAEGVGRGLRSFYERVVWNVRKQLQEEMETDPMRAIFSMVEETRDRLARAREIERQWERLLYPRRAEIWPQEFSRFANDSSRRQEWLTVIDSVSHCADRLRTALA